MPLPSGIWMSRRIKSGLAWLSALSRSATTPTSKTSLNPQPQAVPARSPEDRHHHQQLTDATKTLLLYRRVGTTLAFFITTQYIKWRILIRELTSYTERG